MTLYERDFERISTVVRKEVIRFEVREYSASQSVYGPGFNSSIDSEHVCVHKCVHMCVHGHYPTLPEVTPIICQKSIAFSLLPLQESLALVAGVFDGKLQLFKELPLIF